MKKVLGTASILLVGAAIYWLGEHRLTLEEQWDRLKQTWDSFGEETTEFKGMEFWTAHQMKLCEQRFFLSQPAAHLSCYRIRRDGIVPTHIELLNDYPIVVHLHNVVPRHMLSEMVHHSHGTNASRDLFTPDKLKNLLEGARIVNQRHIPHRLNPAVEAFTNLTQSLTNLDLDWSSQEWKIVSYGAGFHHSLHSDYLYPPNTKEKTMKEASDEALSFFRRRCLGNTRHWRHLFLCGLRSFVGGVSNYWWPVVLENESYATIGEKGNRVFAVIVYSNTGYEGGKTIFPSLNITVQGAEGDMLVFPISTPDGGMDPDMMHAACPLKSGRKVVSVFMPRERGQELRLRCPWDVNAYEASSFAKGPLADLAELLG